MKSLNYLLITSFILMYVNFTYSQVKIGDNPTTINPNSLLELESTNKGLLYPRMALNDANLIAPMTGTVPEGMIVYNDSGSLSKGYYFWNGTKWIRLETNVNTRTNYVLVKSAADFPTPVAGVISLAAGTLYEINGTILLSNKIDLNGCTVMGMDHMNDKLVYLPASGELFTGANSGTLKMLTLSAPTTGAKLFNLDLLGSAQNTIIQNCVVGGCKDVGVIKNSTGNLLFTDMMFSGNLNGILFQDMLNTFLINIYSLNTNSNTFFKYIGAFETIRIAGGSTHVLAAQTAIGIDISGITSLVTGDLKDLLFLGNGTYVTGTFSNSWEVEAAGVKTEKDAEASGNLYISVPVANPITTVNVPEKIMGTTTSVNLFRTNAVGNNRLVYTGAKSRYFNVVSAISVSSASASKNFSFYIAKNGVVLPESKQTLRMASTADKGSITITCNVNLSTNDYIEVFIENNTDVTGITVLDMNLSIK